MNIAKVSDYQFAEKYLAKSFPEGAIQDKKIQGQ